MVGVLQARIQSANFTKGDFVISTECRQTQIDNIERYCVALLEETPLAHIDKFMLQRTANTLAERFSHSVVNKFVIWSRAILEEAHVDPWAKVYRVGHPEYSSDGSQIPDFSGCSRGLGRVLLGTQ